MACGDAMVRNFEIAKAS